jgi:ELWxxDGT repeat protein
MPAKRSLTLALALLLVAAIPARATGTPTISVIDLAPGGASSNAMDNGTTGELNGYLYFQADDNIKGMELWRSNGANTELVKDICVGGNDSSPSYFAQLGAYLYFKADDCVSGRELWRTNGTTTERVANINMQSLGADSSTPRYFAALGNYLYFQASDGILGTELWRTNGATTELVEDIAPIGSDSSSPDDFTPFGGWLYFSADNFVTGTELWRTNGTTTEAVYDINNGTGGSFPSRMVPFGGYLYFQAYTDLLGTELWRTNGTVTEVVLDIYSGVASSDPTQLTVLGDYLYFKGEDAAAGVELWRTDGTVTEMVADFNPTGDGQPNFLTLFDGGIFMALQNATYGTELCVLDADATDTAIHCWDLRMGSNSTSPRDLTLLGDYLYFSGVNSSGARIIWRIAPDRTREAILPPDGVELDCDNCETDVTSAGGRLYMTVTGSLNSSSIGYEFAYLIEPSYVLPATNRAGSVWSTALVLLAAATAVAGVGLRMRGAQRS